jgi:hypothetical protein
VSSTSMATDRLFQGQRRQPLCPHLAAMDQEGRRAHRASQFCTCLRPLTCRRTKFVSVGLVVLDKSRHGRLSQKRNV